MTKCNILFPLKDKSAAEIARLIEAYVGPPHIFHSDNGREFVNQLLHSLLDQWSSNNITFVNRCPCHSQSQGLVERGNRVIQEKIAAIKCEEGYEGELSFPWASWLPRIMFNLNTQWHATTKEMPYKLVFGQVPQSALLPGASRHVVNEEDMNSVISASPPKVVPTPSLKEEPASSSSSMSQSPEQLPSLPTSPANGPLPSSTSSASDQTTSSPRMWVIPLAQQKELTWTSSSPDSAAFSPSFHHILQLLFLSRPLTHGVTRVITKQRRQKEPATSSKHEPVHKKARDETFKAAFHMAQYYNKSKCTTPTFKEGDKISFAVPKIDRCSTDMSRIPGVILNVSGGHKVQFYQVVTSVGIIKHKFHGGDLASYAGCVTTGMTPQLSIHEAAVKINAANRFTQNRR